jgi:hypothetical protein
MRKLCKNKIWYQMKGKEGKNSQDKNHSHDLQKKRPTYKCILVGERKSEDGRRSSQIRIWSENKLAYRKILLEGCKLCL